MVSTLAKLPTVHFTDEDVISGEMPYIVAQAALEHGPVLARTTRQGTVVLMVGPEANRFAMHTHREHFSHALGWDRLMGDTLGKGLLNMDEPEHGIHRKMWNPAFASACMAAYVPVMQHVVEEHTRRWTQQSEVDMLRETREIAFDVAATALAGFEPGPQVNYLRRLFYILMRGDDPDTTRQGASIGWFQAQQELGRTLLTMIAERRRAPAQDHPGDVLSAIVHTKDENGQTLSDMQVLAHLNVLLIAGHETTTTLSAWALYKLATLQKERRRIEGELHTALGEQEGPASFEAIRGLKALDNFIKETGRLYSPVLNVPRGVLSDVEFAGHIIPAGSQVRLALAATHRLPNIFEEPRRFDPDRFASPREEDRLQPYSLVTFGGGPRTCIGINFANIEVKVLTAHVLRHYSLEPMGKDEPVYGGYWTAETPGGIRLKVAKKS